MLLDATVLAGATQVATRLRRLLARATSPAWLFYCWAPIGIGLFIGSMQAGRTALWPISYSMAFWVVVCCIDWWLVDLGCRLARRLLAPWRPGLLIILVVGSLAAAALFVVPVNRAIIELCYMALPASVPRLPLPAVFGFKPDQAFPSLAPWFLANYVFWRVGRMPRYGIEPPQQQPAIAEPESAAAELPVFLDKVREDRRGDLLALNAQGHYLRVITTGGEDLVLHTFGDAVKELGDDIGLRVHRSWWVSRRALADGELESTKRLRLDGGVEVPVSRTFRAQLLQAAKAESANQQRV
jgi:DNA-binding LytR/AlgR family response regulator